MRTNDKRTKQLREHEQIINREYRNRHYPLSGNSQVTILHCKKVNKWFIVVDQFLVQFADLRLHMPADLGKHQILGNVCQLQEDRQCMQGLE